MDYLSMYFTTILNIVHCSSPFILLGIIIIIQMFASWAPIYPITLQYVKEKRGFLVSTMVMNLNWFM